MHLATQAWRNLFRNTRRTILSGALVAFGVALLMFFDGLMIGMSERMVENSTILGQAQIHYGDFRTTRDAGKTIKDWKSLQKTLESETRISSWTPRTVTLGMVTSPDNATGALILGMDPLREKSLSGLHRSIHEGVFLDQLQQGELVLGLEAAKKLKLALGEKLVITSAHAQTGELVQQVFRVGGLLRTGIDELDKSAVLLPLHAAQALLGLENEIHEIGINFVDIADAANVNLPLWHKLSNDGNIAVGWPELAPDLSKMLSMNDFGLTIMAAILGLVVGVGVLNTLFMAVFERTWELGVMRAIGTRRSHIIKLITWEATWLAAGSCLLGIILAIAGVAIINTTGIDFSGAEFGGAALNGAVYTRFRIHQFTFYPTLIFVFTILISLYPAWVASRVTPATAMARQRN